MTGLGRSVQEENCALGPENGPQPQAVSKTSSTVYFHTNLLPAAERHLYLTNFQDKRCQAVKSDLTPIATCSVILAGYINKKSPKHFFHHHLHSCSQLRSCICKIPQCLNKQSLNHRYLCSIHIHCCLQNEKRRHYVISGLKDWTITFCVPILKT